MFNETSTIHQKTVTDINSKLADLNRKKSAIDYQDDSKLDNYIHRLDNLLAVRELSSLEEKHKEDKKRLGEMKAEEIDRINQELKQIDSMLWKEYSQTELKNETKECKQFITDMENVQGYKKELAQHTTNLQLATHKQEELKKWEKDLIEKQQMLEKLQLQREIYSCPG